MPLRLHMAEGSGPDQLMFLTDDDSFFADVQKDEEGEFVILPDQISPRRKNRKVYLKNNPKEEGKE